jgi:glycosyltransferase involved in cell wall biosynthesis
VTPAVSWLLCSNVVGERLRQAVASCLDQGFANFELLIVANGPHNVEVASSVKRWFVNEQRIRVLVTEARHLTFSLNLGLHHARADLIARMDADDLSYPNRLQKQCEFMALHPEVAVLGSAYDLIDPDNRVLKRVIQPMSDRAIRRDLLWRNPLCHPTVMLRRSVVLNAGGYLGGGHAEDYDLWSRLALDSSVQFANLEEPLIGYRAIPVGGARRARSAYAAVAGAQWRNFVSGGGMAWAAAAVWSTVKAAGRSKQ